MKRLLFCAAAASFLLSLPSHADTTLVNQRGGYSIFLPDGWAETVVSDSQFRYRDTTGALPGQISVVKHTIAGTYQADKEWTRANFITYKLMMQFDPYSVLLYDDSSHERTKDGLWAPEMFVRYYADDTSSLVWEEFIQLCSNRGCGYEFYAMSDTADMDTALSFYGALIYAIHFLDPDKAEVAPVLGTGQSVPSARLRPGTSPDRDSPLLFDPLSRRVRHGSTSGVSVPSGVYLRRGSSPMIIADH